MIGGGYPPCFQAIDRWGEPPHETNEPLRLPGKSRISFQTGTFAACATPRCKLKTCCRGFSYSFLTLRPCGKTPEARETKGNENIGTVLVFGGFWSWFGPKNLHKTGPLGTPWAYTYSKYRLRHEESDFEDPEARGPLFI